MSNVVSRVVKPTVPAGGCPTVVFTDFILRGTQTLSYLGDTVTATAFDAVAPRNENKSTVSFSGSSSVVHFEQFYDAFTIGEAESCGIFFYDGDPNVGGTTVIAVLQFKDDSGASTGDLLDLGATVASNVAMIPTFYKIAVDVDLSNSTIAYKDSEGNSGSLTIAKPGFAANPIFVGGVATANATNNATATCTNNFGTQGGLPQALPTPGSVNICDAV